METGNPQIIIAVTGHRPNKLLNDYSGSGRISLAIIDEMKGLLKQMKPHKVISGVALGIDMLWAETALEMAIPVIAAVPCANQSSRWPESSRLRYNLILNHPLTEVIMVSDGPYDDKCMQNRNVWMVDNSTALVTFWDGTPGGTKNCIDYATTKKNYPIIPVNLKQIILSNG